MQKIANALPSKTLPAAARHRSRAKKNRTVLPVRFWTPQ
jgi:hypothetical protein